MAKSLGGWFRQARIARHLPIRAVAAAADMDQALLSKVELGQRLPTEEQASSIAKFLGIDETKVIGRLFAERFIRQHKDSPAAAREAIIILREHAPAHAGAGKR
jgi:transcriptional regulator with XRE-family HTH domain